MGVGANKQDLPIAWSPDDVATALDISEEEDIPVLPVSAIDKESVWTHEGKKSIQMEQEIKVCVCMVPPVIPVLSF